MSSIHCGYGDVEGVSKKLHEIQNIFHISYLRKNLFDKMQVVPVQEIEIDEKLRYPNQPEKILIIR